jgi:hypothetical protein
MQKYDLLLPLSSPFLGLGEICMPLLPKINHHRTLDVEAPLFI